MIRKLLKGKIKLFVVIPPKRKEDVEVGASGSSILFSVYYGNA